MHPLPSLARREKCNEKRSMWLAAWPCKTCQHLSFYRSGRRSCYQFFLDSPGRKLFPILSYLFKRRWSPMFIMFYGSLNMVLTWDSLILQYPIKYSEFQCSEIESFKLEMFKWIRSQVGCCQTVRQRIRRCSFACMSHSFSWKLWLASNLILFILRRKCWVISSMKGKRTWLKICQNDPLQNLLFAFRWNKNIQVDFFNKVWYSEYQMTSRGPFWPQPKFLCAENIFNIVFTVKSKHKCRSSWVFFDLLFSTYLSLTVLRDQTNNGQVTFFSLKIRWFLRLGNMA